MSDLQVVSTFSGIGGIDRGLELAGAKTVLQCEYDKHARTILARHFPDAAIHNDVTELTADDCRAAGAVPGRTVLTAGWPCQGNSVAGARGGMDDPRSGLWSHVVRLLAEHRPAWFIGENVPGLLSVNDGRDFSIVVHDLARLGYGFTWRILDARHFGVPQRRRRVVIVGRLGDTGAAAAQVLLEPEGVPGNPAAGIEPREIAAGRTDRGAGGSWWTANLASTLTSGAHAPGVRTPGRRNEDQENLAVYVADRTTSLKSAPGGADDNWAQGGQLVAFALRGRDEGAVPEISGDGQTISSIRASGGGSSSDYIASDTIVRRLTPLELERLQGYPDGWTAGQADSQRSKQLGNSVAVPVFEWVGRRLVAVDAQLEVA